MIDIVEYERKISLKNKFLQHHCDGDFCKKITDHESTHIGDDSADLECTECSSSVLVKRNVEASEIANFDPNWNK